MRKVLITATVQSHIAQFHKPTINLLKYNGYEVHVAARDNLSEKNGLNLNIVDKIFSIPFSRNPIAKNNIIAYKQLKKIIDSGNYDVIHCNTPVGGILTRLASMKARKFGTKVFYTAHGFHFYKGASLINWIIYYPIEKLFSCFTDVLITITNEDYDLAMRKRFKCEIIHTHGVGFDSKKFKIINDEEKLNLRNKLNFNYDDFILISIGELNDNKNQKVTIKAVSKLIDIIPNIKLILAGNGPNEMQLKRLANDLKMDKIVTFLGYRTDINDFISLSDILISASIREGLPLNIMEGMSSGKPIVASKNRGHNELIINEVNGLLVEYSNIDGFTSAIHRLYNDKLLQFEFIDKSLELVEKYSINNVSKEIGLVYSKYIGSR